MESAISVPVRSCALDWNQVGELWRHGSRPAAPGGGPVDDPAGVRAGGDRDQPVPALAEHLGQRGAEPADPRAQQSVLLGLRARRRLPDPVLGHHVLGPPLQQRRIAAHRARAAERDGASRLGSRELPGAPAARCWPRTRSPSVHARR